MNKQRMIKLIGAFSCAATLAVVASACTNQNSATGSGDKITYSITKEAEFDKQLKNQPETPYWFPEDLLKWSPKTDKDFKYNLSSVPLAKRVDKKKLPTVNATQDKDMNVVALSIINSSTSGNAPHGINKFDANTFSYWQYIDQLVYWAGSSGEGIIVAPSADVIDAAHKNGVPVLGTVFFPQSVSGGKIEWLDQFLKKDKNGNFPMVDKLIEAADAYGFDGWFINQETDTKVKSFDDTKAGKKNEENTAEKGLNKEHADLMRELIAAYKAKVKDRQSIMWYDSMTVDGKMDWQNTLNDKNKQFMVDADMKPVSDSMFMNFWWTEDKYASKDLLKAAAAEAKKDGINPYNLYAGIDVQADGTSTPVKWNLFTDKNKKPYTSLGLYAPDWTYHSASDAEDFLQKENSFWVNSQGDPTKGKVPTDESWAGVSTFEAENTSITSLPFITNFNLGNGYNYFIEGEKVSELDWNNRSMQDIMPTYRWIFENEGKNNLQVLEDYSVAYNGGNSLKVLGTMEKNKKSVMKLYSTDLKIDKDTKFQTIAQSDDKTNINLVLGYADGKTEVVKADKKVGKKWTKLSYKPKKVDANVTSISLEISTDSDLTGYNLYLGQLSVTPKHKASSLKASNLKLDGKSFDEEESKYAGVKLSWDKVKSKDLGHYEIYRVNSDNTYSFMGVTLANTHYIHGLTRQKDEDKTNFVVVPVDRYGVRGTASDKVEMTWPNNKLPKADFTADKTLIAPNQKVTFENLSSKNAKDFTWTFEGAETKTSTKKNPTVQYKKAGQYSVTLVAKNDEGEKKLVMKKFITVSPKAKKVVDITKGAKADASGFTNDSEAPIMAIDGKSDTKWCATGNPPHTLTIDLQKVKTVSGVDMLHAEAGGENPDMNTKKYSIETSVDGKKYTRVKRVINNVGKETSDNFGARKARYVRLVVDGPTQGSDSAARIYEFKIRGIEDAI